MQILDLLADGQFHSGEQLGRELGISRAAVWKQVEALRKRGVAIVVGPGRGYRLAEPFESWSAEKLRALLEPALGDCIVELRVERATTSTNDVVAERLRVHGRGAVVCLADEQSAGRGRRGRSWFSPPGSNFYGSVGWVFAEGLAVVEGLSLAVGVAAVRALRRYGIGGVGLKWPNDLVAGGAKLGGILIEMQAEAGGHCQVVVGLGLNLSLPANSSEMLGRPVTDVASLAGGSLDRHRLGALLVEELVRLLRDYPARRFAAFREEWEALDSLRGCAVEVSGLAERLEGVAAGVDEHGALLLETSQGRIPVQAGEVSLRATS